MAFDTSSFARIKHYYLKGVLAIYTIAFTSLYLQVQSLFGDNGIVPLKDFMSKAKASRKTLEIQSIIALAPNFGLGYGEFVELLCLLGIAIALFGLVTRRFANAFTFGFLWYIYYSISLVGQGFMSFHSDLMLLEVGFITILLAPLLPTSRMSHSDHDHLTFFLIKWLAFRYFITNVLNVYLDNDEAWYSMNALPMVAQGVQFPSLFSWHVFNAPIEYSKLYQAYEHSVMLCAPFLMFVDLKYSRLLGFYTLLFVALPSALFFNFGWIELTVSICLLAFLKDGYFSIDTRAKQSGLRTFIDILVAFSYISTVVFLLVKYFGIKFEHNVLQAQVQFTAPQFKIFADHFVPTSMVLGVIGLFSSAYTTFIRRPRKTSIIKTLLYTIIVVPLFFSTIPTLTKFAPAIEHKVKLVGMTRDLSRVVAPFMLSNNYVRLSKVSHYYGDHRPELQLQGKMTAEDNSWQQFDLRYKPGLPSRELTRVVPHLPRIDLKMWYASRSTLQNNQWLQTFAYRVATREKTVTDTLARDTIIPKLAQIRIAMLMYKYANKSRQPFAGYWSQSKLKNEYMPTTTVDNLKFAIKSSGISLTGAKPADGKMDTINKILTNYLDIIGNFVRNFDHAIVIWSLAAVAFVSLFK